MDIRKVYLLILLCTFCILSPVYTQQSLSDEFRKVAGDYAALYTSKVEVGYSPYLYINHPYWDTDEFKKGAVCYGGLVYTDLQLRYDTFKKQLIVITPEKRILLQVDMRKVDYFIIEVCSCSIGPGFNYNALFVPVSLLAGLLCMVMSALFRQAAELKADNDLTI